MSTSDIFATTDPHLRNLMRQYSDYFRKNNLNIQNLNLTQSSHPQMYNLSQPNDMLLGQNRRQSDVRSLIQQLMIKKQTKTTANAFSTVNPIRPVLVNTQQRIFQQVINLLMEINDIKETISKEKELTMQMEAERDGLLNKNSQNKTSNKTGSKKINDFQMESIINKLKSKDGQELKISVAQLQKIASQNQNLQKNINRLKIKSKGNLKQVLQEEKQKYRNLKRKLQEKNSEPSPNYSRSMLKGSNPQIIQQIRRLQNDISRLQHGLQEGSNINFEIKKLSEENQRLKQRTIELIKSQRKGLMQSPEEAEQRRQLQEYIREEEQNKLLFFEDLKKFKEQYNGLRQENENLKRQLKGSQSGSRVQNLTNNGRGQDESNKFGQYQNIMNQMHTVMR